MNPSRAAVHAGSIFFHFSESIVWDVVESPRGFRIETTCGHGYPGSDRCGTSSVHRAGPIVVPPGRIDFALELRMRDVRCYGAGDFSAGVAAGLGGVAAASGPTTIEFQLGIANDPDDYRFALERIGRRIPPLPAPGCEFLAER